jgi:ethanolamine utilization protein EutA (predicted chaperonin)
VTNLVTDLAGKAPTSHTHTEANVTNLTTDLAAKAPLVSPAFTTPDIGAGIGASLKLSGRMRDAIVASLVTTVGAATFTAAQFTGGIIIRSGSTAAYSDTTPTAAAIVAAIPSCAVGTAFELTIRNTVAFIETILAGSGVTLSQTTAVAASQARRYLCVVTNVGTPAVTLYGIGGSPL